MSDDLKWILPWLAIAACVTLFYFGLSKLKEESDKREAQQRADFAAACTKVGGIVAHDGHKRVCLIGVQQR